MTRRSRQQAIDSARRNALIRRAGPHGGLRTQLFVTQVPEVRLKAICAGLALFVCLLPAVRDARAADDYLLLRLDDHYVKWGTPKFGAPATLRYAFVQKPIRTDGAINCRSMVPIEPLLVSSAIASDAFEREVASAFALWEEATNISFTRTEDVDKADILIGAEGNPAGYAFTNVAYDHDGPGQVRRIAKSLICLNPTRHWKVGFDGNLEAYDLRFTMAHEIGHAIGLDHPSPSGELMSFRYSEAFCALQPGDIAGAVALYGARGAPVVAAAPKPGPGAPDMALR
jgi:Matrixin